MVGLIELFSQYNHPYLTLNSKGFIYGPDVHFLCTRKIEPPKNKKAPDCSEALILLSRDDWTRTT